MAATAKSFREHLGVPPSKPSTSDSVLVIIDAQNEYASGLLKTENVESTRAAIKGLLDKYRAAGAPVVHVVHVTPAGAPVFTPGLELAEEFQELTPKDGESLVHKQHPGSFTATELQDILENTGRKKIVLTGYMVSADQRGGVDNFRLTRRLFSQCRPMFVFRQRPAKVQRGDGMSSWPRTP